MFDNAPKMGDPENEDGDRIIPQKAMEDPNSGMTLTQEEAEAARARKLDNEGWREQM